MIDFKPGDEIQIKEGVNIDEDAEKVYIVTNVETELYCDCTFNWIHCLSKDGITYSNTSDSFEKTGRHFDEINKALEEIRRSNNE